MKTKTIVAIVIALVVIVGGGVLIFKSPAPAPTDTNTATTDTTATSTDVTATTTATTGTTGGVTATPKGYTMAQVQAHASASSCWTAINGNVYDVTSWISQHPGGSQAILSLCGKDGSNAFNDQHGGQRRPENELASFIIGPLL